MRVPSWLIAAVLCIFTGLLVLVVIVGLVRDQIDTNGLAIVLTPVISGVLLGGGLRINRNANDRPSHRADDNSESRDE